jgi:hypothetical protein
VLTIGAVDGWTISCAAQRHGSCSDALAQRLERGAVELRPDVRLRGDAARDGLHDELVEVSQHVVAARGVAAPPGVRARQLEVLVEQRASDARQVRREARVLEDAGRERVDDAHGAAGRRGDEAGDPQPGVAPQVQRVAPVRVDASLHDVHVVQAPRRTQPELPVAHEEVVALGEGVAEEDGEQGLVVRGLALRTRREQDDLRHVVGRVARPAAAPSA